MIKRLFIKYFWTYDGLSLDKRVLQCRLKCIAHTLRFKGRQYENELCVQTEGPSMIYYSLNCYLPSNFLPYWGCECYMRNYPSFQKELEFQTSSPSSQYNVIHAWHGMTKPISLVHYQAVSIYMWGELTINLQEHVLPDNAI